MVREKFHIPEFPLLRTVASLTALVAVVLGVAMLALTKSGHPEMVGLASLTAGFCLAAAIIALVPIWMVGQAGADAIPGACLVSILIRLTLTLASLVLLSDLGYDRRAMAGWAVGWYVLLLVSEATVLVRFFGNVGRSAAKEVSAC